MHYKVKKFFEGKMSENMEQAAITEAEEEKTKPRDIRGIVGDLNGRFVLYF